MRMPHELMSKTYCGPAKLIPLAQIKNEDGFVTGLIERLEEKERQRDALQEELENIAP